MNKTEIKKYCQRGMIVEAAQFSGTIRSIKKISKWANLNIPADGDLIVTFEHEDGDNVNACWVRLFNFEGEHNVLHDDWIIKGNDGEFYSLTNYKFIKRFGEAQNKLINDEFRDSVPGINPIFYEFRRTGQSFGQALKIIGEAMQNPGKIFLIKDHSGNRVGNQVLTSIIFKTIEQLKLQHFKIDKFDHQEYYLCYEIFKAKKLKQGDKEDNNMT